MRSGPLDEARELVRPPLEVLEIEHSFGEAPEETWHAALEHLPARTQHRSIRQKSLAERQQIVFVAPCTMQEQKNRGTSG
jgi:hypothetical protein